VGRHAIGGALAVLLGSLGVSGCYSGLFDGPTADDPDGIDLDDGADDGDGDDDDDGADDGRAPSGDDGPDIDESYDAAAPTVRLLSAAEYANTVFDLLGVEASEDLDFADVGSGFDNGGEGQLGDALLATLQTEARRIAEEYVALDASTDFPCLSPQGTSNACFGQVVDELGLRAFRRPVDAPSRQALLAFVDAVRPDATDDAEVMELLVARLLLSPRFLYRTEVGETLPSDPTLTLLDPWETASLLSYTLTGSMPDAQLLADAGDDALDDERIRFHVQRLLATDAGRARFARFVQQWLRADELDRMARHPDEYPKLASAAQAEALRDELPAYVLDVVVDRGGSLADLLLDSSSYVNQHTATLYGTTSDSAVMERVELDSSQRGGVLTLASVMAVHSSATEVERDKPIRRGLLIKNQFLCEDIGLPADVDVQGAAADAAQNAEEFDLMTTREQLELMMNQAPACVACHGTFMPFGYLWSHFDALGQYQTHFGDRPLDATVTDLVVDGEMRNYDGVLGLLDDLADSPQVSTCFTRNMARYATGQGKNELVTFLTLDLAPTFRDNELDIVQLLEDMLASPELYVRKGGA